MNDDRNMAAQPPQGAPRTAPGKGGGGVIADPNKVRDPNTETPSKVEDPARVEFPDIGKPDAKPKTGTSGDVQPPKEPAE